MKMKQPVEGRDYYWEKEFMVFTSEFHLQRGQCCGSGCRHCPYAPRWTKGETAIDNKVKDSTSCFSDPSSENFG